MEPRGRMLGPIASETGPDPEGPATVAFGDLVRKLVLFDEIVIDSHNLKEPAALTQKFGYSGAKALFESARIRLVKDMVWIADFGQMPVRPGGNGKVLPLGSYSISPSRLTPPRDFHSRQLHKIDNLQGVNAKQAKKLRQLAGSRIVTSPQHAERQGRDLVLRDFRTNPPIFKLAIASAVKRQFQIELEPSQIELRLEQLREADWSAETNLGQLTELDPKQIHDAVYGGLAAAATLNMRLVLMEGFDALSSFQVNDLPLFEEKLSFIVREIDPRLQKQRLDRVGTIAGLPDASNDPTVDDVDMAKLIEITSGPEVDEFRRWLRTTDSLSDEEVEDLLRPVREAIGKAVRSPAGKAVRLATTAGAGVLLPPVGIGLSAVDTFLVEKLMPEPGPIAFLSRLSHSVFS
jgi:hypothetical protein